jgi:hypothetical protein
MRNVHGGSGGGSGGGGHHFIGNCDGTRNTPYKSMTFRGMHGRQIMYYLWTERNKS